MGPRAMGPRAMGPRAAPRRMQHLDDGARRSLRGPGKAIAGDTLTVTDTAGPTRFARCD